MGNLESKQTSSKAFELWTKDEVAETVKTLGGPKYKDYAESIRDSGMDGGLLSSIEDADELAEMLDELEISSKIHRKVLIRAWQSAVKKSSSEKEEHTKEPSSEEAKQTTSTEDSLLYIDIPDFAAAEKYGLTSFSPSTDLEAFEKLSRQLIESNPRAVYAGVHLCLRDGNHVLRAHRREINGDDGYHPVDRPIVQDHRQSYCSQLVRDKSTDFVVRAVPPEFRSTLGETYVGHVIKNENGDRLGSVCQVINDSAVDIKQEQDTLKQITQEIAAMTQEQLRLRDQLQERNKSLTKQVEQTKKEYAELKTNQEGKVQQEEAASASDDFISECEFLNSSVLATEEERQHIPPSFYEDAANVGLPMPPVGKDDMARVARVEALGLHNMDPDSPMAVQIRDMISRAAQLFRFPVVTLTVQNHAHQFGVATHDSNLGVIEAGDVLTRDKQGNPFCTAYGRGPAMCNWTIVKRKTFFVPDLKEHATFRNFDYFARSYIGTPIITSDGYVVANLCMMDTVPRHDFNDAALQLQFEKMALVIAQSIENWQHRRMMENLVQERKLLEKLSSSLRGMQISTAKRDAPSGEVTIVLTDIQGSTSLWEADADAMKEALVLHDKILRRCISKHSGYEIKTEGDAFHLAFHDPVDAISFALQAQMELYNAPWSPNILALPDACVDNDGLFCGLRVRMGIHNGKSTPQINQVSGRATYSGETFRLAKSIEALCYGGQILASAETWRSVSELMEQLGTPQVVDYGEYVLMTGERINEGILAQSVVQLIPRELAFDYFHATGSSSSRSSLVTKGRQFPQADSARRLTTSFLDAPAETNGTVTMMFIYPSGTDDFADELADRTFATLTKVVRSMLLQVSPPGYECQEDKGKWVIAFRSLAPAVEFGLLLMDALGNAPFDDNVDRESLVRVGIHSGAFSGMGPHPMTGRADYVGPVVNRAARVAAATDAGKVFIGVPVEAADSSLPPPLDLGPDVSVGFVSVKELKGVSCQMALYCCKDKTRTRATRMLINPGVDRNRWQTKKVPSGNVKPTGMKQSLFGSLRLRKGKK